MSLKSNNAQPESSGVHVPSQVADDPCPSQPESPLLHASHFRWCRPRQIHTHQKPWSSRQGSVHASNTVTRQAVRVYSVSQRAEPVQVADLCHEEQLAAGGVPSPPDSGALPQAYVPDGTQHGAQKRCMGPHEVLISHLLVTNEAYHDHSYSASCPRHPRVQPHRCLARPRSDDSV
jgi:hypothetical protein